MTEPQLQYSFKILLVDDELDFCHSLASLFAKAGWQTRFLTDPLAVLSSIEQDPVHLVILDRRMPGMDGINLLKLLKERRPEVSVIMLSGHSDVDAIVEAMRYGAANFFVKPPKMDDLLLEVERIADKIKHSASHSKDRFVARDPIMQRVQRDLIKAAPTQATVLITGESGTGKEIAAETIHHHSARADKPFIKINCAAIAENLLESELFGHERGAFTGATHSHRGRFEQADTGTLFLDEIGDMTLATQAKILRLLQEQQFERLGGEQTITVDVRIIAATHRDLSAMVREGTFREDLYYRLAVLNFHLPALRERPGDVLPLAEFFLHHYGKEYEKSIQGLSDEVETIFATHQWPGNIRELRNCLERAVIFCESNWITPADLSNQYHNLSQMDEQPLQTSIDQLNKTAILSALEKSGWKKQEAAKALNINRRTLYNRMKKLGLS